MLESIQIGEGVGAHWNFPKNSPLNFCSIVNGFMIKSLHVVIIIELIIKVDVPILLSDSVPN